MTLRGHISTGRLMKRLKKYFTNKISEKFVFRKILIDSVLALFEFLCGCPNCFMELIGDRFSGGSPGLSDRHLGY